ncbi:MAG: S8 family serine peptidase [Phycicoccus sp.]
MVAPTGCLTSSDVYDDAPPWPLRRLAATRSWPLARGFGVLVAVVGSGIDARNAQFAPGQVLPGRSFLRGGGAADTDCDGSGTFVAGLVAARAHPRTSVVGLAPDARLLPVRVTQSIDGSADPTDPDILAAGIGYAVGQRAEVIVVYGPAAGPSARLNAAVAAATAAGAVVVAGGATDAGNDTATSEMYPCALPDVVGVAGVDGDGKVLAGSCSGPAVDLAAPGAGLVSLGAGPTGKDLVGHVSPAGATPGYATGYVAGALALVLSYEPGLSSASASQRLQRTADRPANGRRDDTSGWGVIDPYAALSVPASGGVRGVPAPAAAFVPHTEAPVADRLAPVLGGIGLLVAAASAMIGTATVQAGRRRRWRPARRAAPTAR